MLQEQCNLAEALQQSPVDEDSKEDIAGAEFERDFWMPPLLALKDRKIIDGQEYENR